MTDFVIVLIGIACVVALAGYLALCEAVRQ